MEYRIVNNKVLSMNSSVSRLKLQSYLFDSRPVINYRPQVLEIYVPLFIKYLSESPVLDAIVIDSEYLSFANNTKRCFL